MKAMVLAAGYGRRMQPLTLKMSKPAVPVLGRPMIQQVLEQLGADGCREVTINLHHLPSSLRTLLADRAGAGLEAVHLSMEETILGTAGGIRHAAATLRGSGTILIRNSDFLLDIDLKAALAFHKASQRPVTLVLTEGHDLYTPVPAGADGQILSFGALAQYNPADVRKQGVFTGLHLIEEEVLDLIPGPGPSDIIRDVYLSMLQDRKVGAYFTKRFWWEFGTPERYLDGSLQLLKIPAREAQRFCRTDPVREIQGAQVALGPGAQLDSGTQLSGGVAVGQSAAVGKGCTLHDSIILPEAWIGPGVSLSRCIIGPKTEIPAGVQFSDRLICVDSSPGNPLPAECHRENGLVWRKITQSDEK